MGFKRKGKQRKGKKGPARKKRKMNPENDPYYSHGRMEEEQVMEGKPRNKQYKEGEEQEGHAAIRLTQEDLEREESDDDEEGDSAEDIDEAVLDEQVLHCAAASPFDKLVSSLALKKSSVKPQLPQHTQEKPKQTKKKIPQEKQPDKVEENDDANDEDIRTSVSASTLATPHLQIADKTEDLGYDDEEQEDKDAEQEQVLEEQITSKELTQEEKEAASEPADEFDRCYTALINCK